MGEDESAPPKPKGAIIESKPLFASYEKADKKLGKDQK